MQIRLVYADRAEGALARFRDRCRVLATAPACQPVPTPPAHPLRDSMAPPAPGTPRPRQKSGRRSDVAATGGAGGSGISPDTGGSGTSPGAGGAGSG